MSTQILTNLDFNNAARIQNLPNAVSPQEPATLSQLNSLVEGVAWKDSCRVATQANLTLASPGATIDGITMTTSDRVLVRAQTADAENGVYIWNGSAVAMTRALDMDAAPEVEQAVTTVEEGTSAGVTYRQTVVNVTLGTTALAWSVFGTAAGAASETSAGIAEVATQAETDAGTDDLRIVSPLKLKASPFARRSFAQDIGDGSATSITLTHNLASRDVRVEVFRNSGNYDTIHCDVQRPSTNTVTLVFAAAPTAAQFRALITLG